jgi:hypothetical protein
MRKNRLRWFGHVMRRKETNIVRVIMKKNVEGKKEEKDQKKRWLDTIENYIRAVGVCVGDVENRDELKFRTRVIDPK